MVKVIVGLMGGSVMGGAAKLSNAEQLRPFLSMLSAHKITEVDTARVYNKGRSEELMGEVSDTTNNFKIATKAPGFFAGSLTYDNVIKNCNASLAALKTTRIDLYYFHGPDSETPLEDSCRAINQLHQEGKFTRFGISNFNNEQVLEIVSLCKKHSWLLPTVYQGGYNPMFRAMETKLLHTLREHSISFYAYSPLGGGYFSKTTDQLRTPPAGGRMESMKVFQDMYVNDLSLEMHEQLQKACEQAGISMKEACLRWLLHHSSLNNEDGIILGGSSTEQMEENLNACHGGALPASLVAGFGHLYTRLVAERGVPAYSL
ncbi:hypothetical protein AMS68_003190 [Peltaster fructicola]|uniref:NADP-dependent oxidoreductase domain-containing protein n=1 Tax=Peltaster fructicola TaxID=286661 RepID=A0A6H0XSH7_9PEZI|nr:hypothetical protein AMS68_003190 [Peltaster fructicola]